MFYMTTSYGGQYYTPSSSSSVYPFDYAISFPGLGSDAGTSLIYVGYIDRATPFKWFAGISNEVKYAIGSKIFPDLHCVITETDEDSSSIVSRINMPFRTLLGDAQVYMGDGWTTFGQVNILNPTPEVHYMLVHNSLGRYQPRAWKFPVLTSGSFTSDRDDIESSWFGDEWFDCVEGESSLSFEPKGALLNSNSTYSVALGYDRSTDYWVQTSGSEWPFEYVGTYTNLKGGTTRILTNVKQPLRANAALEGYAYPEGGTSKVLMFSIDTMKYADYRDGDFAGWPDSNMDVRNHKDWCNLKWACLERENVLTDRTQKIGSLVEDEVELFKLASGCPLSIKDITVLQSWLLKLAEYFVDINKVEQQIRNGEPVNHSKARLEIDPDLEKGWCEGDLLSNDKLRNWMEKAKSLLQRMRYIPLPLHQLRCTYDRSKSYAEYYAGYDPIDGYTTYNAVLAQFPTESDAVKYWHVHTVSNQISTAFIGVSIVDNTAPNIYRWEEAVTLNESVLLGASVPVQHIQPIGHGGSSSKPLQYPNIILIGKSCKSNDAEIGDVVSGRTVVENQYYSVKFPTEGVFKMTWDNSTQPYRGMEATRDSFPDWNVLEATWDWSGQNLGDDDPPANKPVNASIPSGETSGVALWGNRIDTWVYLDYGESFNFSAEDESEESGEVVTE